MIFILTKILPALLSPTSLICLLCLAASRFAFRHKAHAAGKLALTAALLLYASASPIVSHFLLRGLESQYPEPESYPKAAAIVLLGGATVPDLPPRRHPETNGSGDRLLQAARLWRAQMAPKLIVTGGAIPFLTGYEGDEATLYAGLLTDLFDVPDSAILKVSESRNTFDDARMTASLFRQRGLSMDILLVTSAAHMLRAARLFRKQGFRVHPAPADYRANARYSFTPFHLLPSEEALDETGGVLHEYLGLAAYRLMGRM